MRVPLSNIDLSQLEIQNVEAALREGAIARGPFLELASRELARFCEVEQASLVVSGTAALHAALAAFGVRPGDEVIVPGVSFVSPAQCVARCGAIPVFADVHSDTWCIDPEEVDRLAGPRTKGVIAVDVIGHPANYDELTAICRRRHLFLIEDAAQAHGSRYKGRRTGSLGDVATFSFFANKTLTTGEGGAVVSVDKDLIARIDLLKNHGMSQDRPYYHPVVGDNWKASNLMAGILYAQLIRSEELIARRTAIADRYRAGLAGLPTLHERPVAECVTIVPWLVTLMLDERPRIARDDLVGRLRHVGIDARATWKPLVELPPYRLDAQCRGTLTPRSRDILSRTFWLPTSSRMMPAEVDLVIHELRAILLS